MTSAGVGNDGVAGDAATRARRSRCAAHHPLAIAAPSTRPATTAAASAAARRAREGGASGVGALLSQSLSVNMG
jgi:hypothetical protein